MRALIAALAFIVMSTATAGDTPHDEGLAAGRNALAPAQKAVTAPSASNVVPEYGQTVPEQNLDRRQLSTQARQRLLDCMGRASPDCEALSTAQRSANTARPAIAPDTLAAAIQRNPGSVLGSLASFYSGCTTIEREQPATTITPLCQYGSVPTVRCRRDLSVEVARTTANCTEDEWIATGRADRNSADHMVAQAQCRLQAGGLQRFRFHAWGGKGACRDWQEVDLPTTPAPQAQVVADLAPHWQGYCWPSFKVVMAADSGCTDTQCNYRFDFGTPTYGCLAGATPGSELIGYWNTGSPPSAGSAQHCFSLSPAPSSGACATGSYPLAGSHAGSCAKVQGPRTVTGATGWTIPLNFARPSLLHTETDHWDDKCPLSDSGGRCQLQGSETCVDGPATRQVQGVPVQRACWSYERDVRCGAPADGCASLQEQGCTPLDSECVENGPGSCVRYQARYSCPQPAQTTTEVGACSPDRFCVGSSCFNTGSPPDADFAQAMTMMEAGREAGVYLDIDTLQVFKGEANRCRERLLKNCCGSDSAGSGMSNQRLFGVGSRLVYDVLMNSENRAFITQGLNALMTSGGFSGAFTSYGVTLAVNGTALPAGSVVLASNGTVVVAVDPWSLAIAVVVYVALDMMQCSSDEGKLALKQGAGLCHSVGRYCSTCLKVLGKCTTCTEYSTGKCCFNSRLARIINEQGRQQVGRGWGTGERPDCSGFTIAELQRLDFADMDLSEFYASLQPVLPDAQGLQNQNQQRIADCYYGQGRCP